MKNSISWAPSKYVYENNILVGSRNRAEVGLGSRLITDLVAKFYQSKIPMYAAGRLLDLGCGKIPLYIVYKDFITDSVCVDWGNTLHKNPNLDLECDLTKPLPLPNESFETIILSDVLEHIAEPEFLWQEMTRLLKPGGRIIMNVPFYYWLHEQPHDYYRYTEFALKRFVDQAGLKLLEIEAIGGAAEVMADIFAKTILRLPRLGPPLAVFSQWFVARLVRTKRGRAWSDATKKSFPFGYFLVAEKPAAH